MNNILSINGRAFSTNTIRTNTAIGIRPTPNVSNQSIESCSHTFVDNPSESTPRVFKHTLVKLGVAILPGVRKIFTPSRVAWIVVVATGLEWCQTIWHACDYCFKCRVILHMWSTAIDVGWVQVLFRLAICTSDNFFSAKAFSFFNFCNFGWYPGFNLNLCHCL